MLKTLILTLGTLIIATVAAGQAKAASPANTLYIELSTGGTVTVELLPDRAPAHVERVKTLARDGFYDGIVFHRVIAGFMAQTGDPTGTGTSGSDLPDLHDEFTNYDYKRGTIGAATSGPHTANSQFFICFTDRSCKHLNGKHSVWGQVIEGMEHVDKTAKRPTQSKQHTIVKMWVGSDVAPVSDQ